MEEFEHDSFDKVVEDWQREQPLLDFSGLAVFGRIMSISNYLQLNFNRVLRQVDLPLWGFDVLFALRRVGSPYVLSPSQLIKACFLTSGAMTHRLDRLTDKNYIERRYSAVDRRSVDIILTPKGKELIDAALPARLQHGLELLQHINGSERQQLTQTLRKILLSLEASEKPLT